jgi:glycosyltransferase involved in cell wall biosynthesis
LRTILQINTVGNTGSTGRIVEEIGQVAIKNGWTSYIGYGRKERVSKSQLIKIGTDLDIKYHVLMTRLFDRQGLESTRATKRLIGEIVKINPDIIHLHNLHGYYLNIEVLFSFLAKSDIPVVWTLHDCWAFTGHCVHFSFVNCMKWKTECFDCPQLRTYPKSLFFDRSKSNYKLKKKLFTSINNLTIVTVSNWLKTVVQESFLSSCSIKVINNGIDLGIFSGAIKSDIRQKFNCEGKFVILGVATDWIERKGLYDFFEISKQLSADYQIILVGLTDSQLKKLPREIIGMSKTESIQSLAELYSMVDLFLNLSVEETFGLTTVEALACGTPVIVYDSTACPEVVTPETGIVVKMGDISGLLSSIEQIRIKGKESFSANCIAHARMLFDKNDRYKDYINLYESILG